MFFKKLYITLIFVITIMISCNTIYAASLIPSGESIGIKLNYDGVIITGGYNLKINNENYHPLYNGLTTNDIITHINDIKIDNLYDLSNKIKENITNNKESILTVNSNGKIFYHKLIIDVSNEDFNTGLYVKDSLIGIGTLTYYNPETNSFGSLGHSMTDISLDGNTLIEIGEIYNSNVTGIIKGSRQATGQKIADIETHSIGSINDHNQYGIYGTYVDKNNNNNIMETAGIEEVKLGKAYFLTVLQGQEVEKCEIEITNLKKQDTIDTKGISFKIIDKDVMDKSNGIIQGMSGSPIIQDNKIIGCVTHVTSNDPSVGYGLYIEWMLDIDNNN